MNTVIRIVKLTSQGALAISLLSGCALTKDYVGLTYIPQPNVSKIPGADAVAVNVEVNDLRSIKDKVSAKINGFGNEMAPIIATNDVVALVKSAIETELTQRGFSCGGKTVIVSVALSKFYSNFKTGFWSGSAVAEVTMDVQVKNADGGIAFSNLIAGAGLNPSLQVASGSNARIALEAALKDAMSKLTGDPAFIESLLKSGQKVAADSHAAK